MEQSILYWKWDDTIFENGRMEFAVKNIVERSTFDLIYVSFHHLGLPYTDARLYAKIEAFCAELARHGRKVLLDIDVRGELAGVAAEGGEQAEMLYFIKASVDNGRGRVSRKNHERGRTGRASTHKGPERITGAWAVGDPAVPVCVTFTDDGTTTVFDVSAGRYTGEVLIAAAYTRGIPDLFSDKTYDYYERMIAFHKDLPIAGAANDEWGFDVALECDNCGLFTVHGFPYTDCLERAFVAKYGYTLIDKLWQFCIPAADGSSCKVINDYLELLRAQMKYGNDFFYDTVKKTFGPDAFVGVHPTFWGDPHDCGIDVLQNGLDWWEVKRDAAQTDEFVIMPVRLALLHKSRGRVWYNMWYSGNTQQLHTYFAETYRNAAFAGRTHYLGYECPNEPGVYNLKHPQGLEEATLSEQQVEKLRAHVSSVPDSRVLVVFGTEAACNWLNAYNEPVITRGTGLFPSILRFADGLCRNYLCDLVPSSEIDNGSLTLVDGRPVYGDQTFDAVIYLEPQYMTDAVHAFMNAYAETGRLIVAGDGDRDRDGRPSDWARRLKDKAYARFDAVPTVREACMALDGVAKNVVPEGCVYRDGTVVMTSGCDAVLPAGNYTERTFTFENDTVQCAFTDFIVLKKDKEGLRVVCSGSENAECSIVGR